LPDNKITGTDWLFAHPTSENEKYFITAVKRTNTLLDLGFNVYCPSVFIYFLNSRKPRTYEFWLDLMIGTLDRYDGLILAPEWSTSHECWLLFGYFLAQRKPVMYYEKLIKVNENEKDYLVEENQGPEQEGPEPLQG
jgi:hypothetical protein